MDGRKQRNALTAAEQAIAAIAAGDARRAVENAAKAAELDQIGVYAQLPGAVATALADLDAGGRPSPAAWERLRHAVPDGPLDAMIESQPRR